MKFEFDQTDIQNIAHEVAELIKPLLCAPEGDKEPFFTVSTLSEHLGVKESWIYQQVHARKIPYYKVGKYVRFKRSEITAWENKLKRSH
jgi:excisionase family DNA binding protein